MVRISIRLDSVTASGAGIKNWCTALIFKRFDRCSVYIDIDLPATNYQSRAITITSQQ